MTDDLGRPRKGPVDDPQHDIAGALHDVSNALTVLLGWVAEARDADGRDPQALRYALGIIERRARAARDLARRAIGAQLPVDANGAVDEVVRDVVATLALEAQRAGVQLETRGRLPGVEVQAPTDLAHVLTNLVLNAVAHAPRGTAVGVEISRQGTAASIDVTDAGRGVEAERAASIFAGDSRRVGGAGVGLRHARAVAQAAGGDVTLAPATSGTGARFRVRWPALDPIVESAPVSAARVPVLLGRRVLVLEDDAAVVALLEAALGARGADVTVARTASELRKAAAQPVDVALLDLSPIASDVEGALAALRQVSPEAALVVISGSATGLPDAFASAGDSGAPAVRWVRKPFEITEIVAALEAKRDRH